MLQAEIIRGVIHQVEQFPGFVDDGCPVAPGKDGGKETGDLDILFAGEAMGDGNGVVVDE